MTDAERLAIAIQALRDIDKASDRTASYYRELARTALIDIEYYKKRKPMPK